MNLIKLGIRVGAGALLLSIIGAMTFDTVEPRQRGIAVEFGKVQPNLLSEGFHWHSPTVDVHTVDVSQQTHTIPTNITTRDLQKVKASIAITYRVPDDTVISVWKEYKEGTWTNLVAPRTLEAIQSAASRYNASELNANRNDVKAEAKRLLEKSTHGMIEVTEISINDITFDEQYQNAIKSKLVAYERSQEAKSKLEEEKLKAQATVVAGQAITASPMLLKQRELEIEMEKAKRWKGDVPQSVTVIGDDKQIIYGLNK
jgi:prohibitin 2